ncbi:hypothetical protein OIU78_016895 [Salix suchowensis]|nr:hypothetical protein OIU78_016895 [Salix suchowensis]
MLAKVLDDGLVLYSSHAQHISQRRGNGSNNSLSRGAENVHGVSPPLSPVVTTSIANESLSSSSYSNSKASENNGSHSNSKVMVTAATTTKKLGEEVVSLFLLSAAIAPKGKDVLSSSPSKAKENGGSKVREDSESLAAKIDPRDGHATNAKEVSTTIKVTVKWRVPIKEVIPEHEKPIVQNLNETTVKERNGKPRVVNDPNRTKSLLPANKGMGNIVSNVGMDKGILYGLTTRNGIRRTTNLPRSKGLKGLTPTNYLC